MIESEIYREENNNMKRADMARLSQKGHIWQSKIETFDANWVAIRSSSW